MIVPPGATSISVDVFFADDTGAAVIGKVAADFPVCRWSSGSNTADTTITLSDLAAITTPHPNDNVAGGVHEREGGWYRLDLPNNVQTAGGRKTITFAETTNKRILAPQIDCQYPQTNVIQVNGTAQTAADLGSVVTENGADLDELISTVGAAGAGLTAVPDSATLTEINADVDEIISTLGAAGAGLTALGDTRLANLDVASSSLATATNLAEANADLDELITTIGAAGAGLTGITGASLASAYDFAKGTVAMTESYNADGAAPTPVQSLMGIMQMLMEMSAAGTVITVKKLDGTTTAFTLATNDATTPTSITRSG